MKNNDKKKLSLDDKKVWDHVTKTVTPLGEIGPPEKGAAPATVEIVPFDQAIEMLRAISPKKPIKPKRSAPGKKPKKSGPAKKPRRATPGKRTSEHPQRVLDLHGMTRDEAYKYLQTQLNVSKMRGHKIVEIITGKGHGKGDGLGILKRKVPLWMEGAKFGSLVKSWQQVPGNEGAIYVYLR